MEVAWPLKVSTLCFAQQEAHARYMQIWQRFDRRVGASSNFMRRRFVHATHREFLVSCAERNSGSESLLYSTRRLY